MSSENENPEEEKQQQIAPEEYLLAQKKSIRKKSWWAVGIGGFIVLVHLGWLVLFAALGGNPDFSVLFRSIFFVLGLFALAAGIWGFYYAKNLDLKELIPSAEAVEFLKESASAGRYYTFVLVGCIAAVFLVQLSTGLEESILAAGFVKDDVIGKGEYWRILTGGALHGGFLHIYFNSQALFGIASMIEVLSNRAHLAIVFLLSVIGGGLLSLAFMPTGQVVGASGGIMGLIGYLAVYGYRRKAQLPPDFLKSVLINIAFIAAFGLIAYQIIDNFSHAGGLLVGSIYGFIQVPRDLSQDPRKVSRFIEIAGIGALAIYIAEAAFAIFRIAKLS